MTTSEFMHQKQVRYPLVAATYALLGGAVVGGIYVGIWGTYALGSYLGF